MAGFRRFDCRRVTVDELRLWLLTRPRNQLLWPGTWYTNNDAAEMLRRDLIVAGLPIETVDGVIDFHALRSQCGTDLARAGVPLTMAQKILGHSTPLLTAKFYSRHGLSDLADAVGKVGQTPPAEPEKTKRKRKPKK